MKIYQTKYSGNNYWSDLLYQNPEILGPGSNALNAIALTYDSNDADTLNYDFKEGQTVWVKWTNSYQDYVDFYLFCNGLIATPSLISNYTAYESDATTIFDISGSNVNTIGMGSGPDTLGREGNFVYLAQQFLSGQTYYLTFIVPFTGTYGLCVQGD